MTEPRRQKGLFARLRGDRRGVSAVEFAMLAPVMIGFYFGMAEFCQGFMAQKRMGHAASQVADLVAQKDVITTAEVSDVFGIGALIMKPYSSAPLKMRVTSVARQADGSTKVEWSQGSGLTALAKDAAFAVPAGVLEAEGETVIVSESTYDYDSPVDYFMPGVTQFRHTYYLRPRSVERVKLLP